jgi:hypothetical protein
MDKKNKSEWQKADIKFTVNGKKHKFSVVHNLPRMRGTSVEDAFNNWIVKTSKYTDADFCEYIMSKDPSFLCITMGEYSELNKTNQ